MDRIVNAAPGVLQHGTDDKSKRIIYPTSRGIPLYLTKSYIYAKKGGSEPTQVDGPTAISMYGSETFDKNFKYMNHSTIFAKTAFSAGSEVIVQRVIPDDAKKATMTLYLDLKVKDDVPLYERNEDGTYKLDGDNNPIETGETVNGYTVKTVVDRSGTTPEIKEGLIEGGTMYPIITLTSEAEGDFYNNFGFSLDSIDKDISSRMLDEGRILPYVLTLFTRENEINEMIKTLSGELGVTCGLKKLSYDPLIQKVVDFPTELKYRYSNTTDPIVPMRYNNFEDVVVYYDNLDLVLNKLTIGELSYLQNDLDNGGLISDWFDFKVNNENKFIVENELYVFDIFKLMSTQKAPYSTVVRDDTERTVVDLEDVVLSKDTPIYLTGGTDGTISDVEFEKLVVKDVKRYLDKDDIYQNELLSPESVLVDSGFSVETKEELTAFISVRKDTFLFLSTYVVDKGIKYNGINSELDLATRLKNKLKMMPESTYFGTPVMRGAVQMGCGIERDNEADYLLPQTLDTHYKCAKYMGAGNGKWKNGEAFDKAPKNIIYSMYNLYPVNVPNTLKPFIWDKGINISQNYDKHLYHVPAYQTVYDDDTSVLNSIFTAIAICTIERAGKRAWREFTGVSSLTNAQLEEGVVNFINKDLAGRFDGRFIIINEVVFTRADIDRGYSWELISKIGAGNMKTVMTHRIESYRFEDIGGAK